MTNKREIEILLDTIFDKLNIVIIERKKGTLFDADGDSAQNNEARYQLIEGCFYDYEINNPRFVLEDPYDGIVIPHKRKPNLGTIAPNIYVGTLEIPIKDTETGKIEYLQLEVQSIKSGYRDDYRDMLEFITEKCTDLILQSNSPASH
jgi:hypothetical protein